MHTFLFDLSPSQDTNIYIVCSVCRYINVCTLGSVHSLLTHIWCPNRHRLIEGFIDKNAAIMKLEKKQSGTFLVRFSEHCCGGVSIAYTKGMCVCVRSCVYACVRMCVYLHVYVRICIYVSLYNVVE